MRQKHTIAILLTIVLSACGGDATISVGNDGALAMPSSDAGFFAMEVALIPDSPWVASPEVGTKTDIIAPVPDVAAPDLAVDYPVVPTDAAMVGLCPAPSGVAVTLSESNGVYTLSNGLITLTINAAGNLTQVAKGGKNLMASGDTLYVSENGGSSYYAIHAGIATVVQQGTDIAELSFQDTSGGLHDMDWDIHYVLRRGVSGFYYFLIAKVGTASHPDPATLGELRTVQRFDPALLPNGYNGERHGALPTTAQNAGFGSATQIQDSTWPLSQAPDPLPGVSSQAGPAGQSWNEGPVYSKYDWATYRTEDRVHGLYGNGYGVWLLSPSWEFYTGGPLKQELMVHHSNLILNMYHGGHFGSATTTASPASWAKIYGPNLVYVNAGADAQVITDAVVQAETERAQWPYCWMKNALFPPLAERGTVTGRLVEAHGQPVAGAMVTLAQDGNLMDQAYDYLFWAQADATGNFTVSAVRPGTYSIHVYPIGGSIIVDSANGEIVGKVTVKAGANNLGTVTWSPPYHANLLWAIGMSDQRSGEFRFSPTSAAGPDNTAARTGRMYGPDATHGVWTVPPANVTYTIGTSTSQTDWYFVQSVDGDWTVNFKLPTVPIGGAFLTIGVAGATRNPHLTVTSNGHQVLSHGFGTDASLYRSALQGGQFELLTAAIPAADLVAGKNSLVFNLNTKGTAGAGVFYDIVKLESD